MPRTIDAGRKPAEGALGDFQHRADGNRLRTSKPTNPSPKVDGACADQTLVEKPDQAQQAVSPWRFTWNEMFLFRASFMLALGVWPQRW